MANVKKLYLLLTATYILLSKRIYAETYTLGYITGSKRRSTDYEYQRPGFRISGGITLAVEEVNAGELGKRGHNLDFLVAETYGEEETSIKITADFYSKNISAYIGPQESCIHEGRMAAAFNIPMISYFCTQKETSNKEKFPTFARTRPPDTQISKSVVSVLLAFNWTKVTFMHVNSTMFSFNKMSTVATTILASFQTAGITVNHRRSWSEPYYATHMKNPFRKHVKETYQETRSEYWVLGVDIEQYDEKHPNKYLHGLWQKERNLSIVNAYRSYFNIVASAPINFINFTRLINKYRQKPPFNFTNPLANIGGIVQIVPETAYLYDAVHLYEKLLLKAMDEKRDPRNGREMMSALHGIHYKSAMGYKIYMDENGDAEGNYTLIALDHRPSGGFGLYPIGYFIGKEKTNLPKLRLIKNMLWIGDGPPVAEPYCGYHGEKCNSHIGEIVGGIIGTLLLIIAAIVLIFYRNRKYEQELDSLLWKINYKDIQIKEQTNETIETDETSVRFNSNKSSTTQSIERISQVSLNSNPESDFRYATIYTQIGLYKGQIFAIKKIRKKSIELTREIKKQLKTMRDLRHDNLNSFIGACTDPPNICIIVEYCVRGSLKDILENEDIKLDNMFMASLVGDIIRGMIYLHESVIKYHGSLSTSNCLIDSRWVVKLTEFGLREFKLGQEWADSSESKKKQYHKLLYKAPEFLRRFEKPIARDFQKGDVYSFAIVLFELQGRHGPFGITELSVVEILTRVITNFEILPFRPPLEQLENTFNFVRTCMSECWAENPNLRPDFKMIKNKLRPLRKGMKANIFDNMMTMMEKYANNLEALVDERTDQLNQEKKKTDALLYQILPRYVAEQLKMGKKVEAENFDCVTIYFSDIVDFTCISAESTPLEVIDFLNDLYTCFDSTVEKYDVYKVETVGDAYMVVSGLPIKNDIKHAGEIASMSLCVLDAIKQFTIRHRPLEKLKIRIGIHSGPVCAGVIGLKMPRYCLFGDTVNTASRMESTGLPLKIHCSNETKQLLDQLGGFSLIERGVVSMKGKGDRMTYWLIGENPILRNKRNEERTSIRNGDKKTSIADPLVPRSSLKNKSLVRSTLMRCSSETSSKRLRFASSDQLDQKGSRVSQLESIVDNKMCKTKISCVLRSSCMKSWQSSSNSCPCVEKLCETQETEAALVEHKISNIKNLPLLRTNLIFRNESYLPRGAKSFGTPEILQSTCQSAPCSPKHSSAILNVQKRAAQSNEEIDGWGAMTPLIYYPNDNLNNNSQS